MFFMKNVTSISNSKFISAAYYSVEWKKYTNEKGLLRFGIASIYSDDIFVGQNLILTLVW